MMGRGRPKNVLGRSRPKNSFLGQTRPRILGWTMMGRGRPQKNIGPISAQKILFWAKPGPEDWAGPGPAWPSNKTGGGRINFSPAPACRTLFVLHAEKEIRKCQNRGGRRVPGAEEVVALSFLAEAVAVA